VALLVDGTAGYANPQAGPRATFAGRIAVSADPAHRARFLARHPAAKLYAGFSDFEILRVAVERVHWVGGFARAAWLDFAPTPADTARAVGEAEAGILDHMNADHADAIQRYAAVFLKRRGRAWRMAGCDSDGCDLVQGGRMVRLTFDRPARTPGEIRERLVQMAQAARLPSP
jgi:putative heme iron utilization protein